MSRGVMLVSMTMNDPLVRSLAAVMRQVRDPAVRAVGVWSIGETAAHVSGSSGYFLAAARG